MKFKAILFDKDGVLVNSIDNCLKALNDALEHYGHEKFDKEEFRKKFWGIRPDISVVKNLDVPEDEGKKIFERYKRKRVEFREMSKLYPGAREVLEKLKDGYKMAIVTSTFRDIAVGILEDFEILDYFDAVVAGDDAKPKPAPDPLLKACEILGVEINDAVYVGDTNADIEAGKAAGCKMVVVATSKTRDELSGIEGITIIDRIDEILKIVS